MAELIVYDITGLKHGDKVKFGREMFGYVSVSHKGKYKYKRTGLIGDLLAYKFSESVIAVRSSKDKRSVVSLLKKYGITYKIYRASISSRNF